MRIEIVICFGLIIFQKQGSPGKTPDGPKQKCESPPSQKPPFNDIDSLSIFELIHRTEKTLPKHDGDAVLLLGIPNSRKNIIGHVVTGNLDDLMVYRTKKGVYHVVDKFARKQNASFYLIPDKITDKSNGLVILDMPVFNPNRSSIADLTVKYLMQQTVINLKSFSIVLVVPEDSLKLDAKIGYAQLITEVAEIMTDLSSIEQSVGLLVTNVLNADWKNKTRTDLVVFRVVRSFLSSFISEERKKQAQNKPKQNSPTSKSNAQTKKTNKTTNTSDFNMLLSNKKIQLTNMLLQDNKIAVLREPDACGSFQKSSYIKSNRINILKLMTTGLPKSTFNVQNHFRFPAKSLPNINFKKIFIEMNSIVTEIIKSFVLKITAAKESLPLQDFWSMKRMVSEEHREFSALINSFNSSSPKSLGVSIIDILRSTTYDRTIGMEVHENLTNIEVKMEFFELVIPADSRYSRTPVEWIKPLKQWVEEELTPRNDSYIFLDDLREYLGSSQFQTNKKKGSVYKTIEDVKSLLDNQHVTLSATVLQFFQDKKDAYVEQILQVILEEAFHEPKSSCSSGDPPVLTIKGTFIKFSQLNGEFVSCSGEQASKWVIMASRRIFVDNTVNLQVLGNSYLVPKELALFSPSVNVTTEQQNGAYHVSLQGVPGRPGYINETFWTENILNKHLLGRSQRTRSRRTVSALDVRYVYNIYGPSLLRERHILPKCRPYRADILGRNGTKGDSGAPGQHGEPGGNFLLVAQVIKGHKFGISVAGGKGGNGENGKPGDPGRKSINHGVATYLNVGNSFKKLLYNFSCNFTEKPKFREEFESCLQKQIVPYFEYCMYDDFFWEPSCYFKGCPGGYGGHGGVGGKGGNNGEPGEVALYFQSKEEVDQYYVYNTTDEKSFQGEGGSGGDGGRFGLGFICGLGSRLCKDLFLTEPHILHQEHIIPVFNDPGQTGVSGNNTEGQATIKQPGPFLLSPSKLSLQYLEFMLGANPVFFPQEDYFEYILNTSNIFSHNLTEFGEELLVLERSNVNLKIHEYPREKIAFIMHPRYESLQLRMDNFSNSINETALTAPQKKLMSLILSTVALQLKVLKQVSGVTLVTDMEKYLTTLDQRLGKYDDFEKRDAEDALADQRQKLIEEERKRYKDIFLDKIGETLKYISETVDPEITKVDHAIKSATTELYNAVDDWIKAKRKQEEAYREAAKKAEANAWINGVCGALKVGAAAVSMFGGPKGQIIGAVVDGVVSVAQPLALQTVDELPKPEPLPATITKYADLMDERAKMLINIDFSEVEQVNKQCKDLTTGDTANEIQKIMGTQKFEKLLEVHKELETHLEARKEKNFDSSVKKYLPWVKKVSDATKAIVSTIGSLSTAVGNYQNATNISQTDTSKKTMKNINKAENAIKLATMVPEIVDKVLNDIDKMEELTNMADEVAEQQKDLGKYKSAIDQIMTPFAESVISGIMEEKENMKSSSEVRLRIQKYKIQGTLSEFKAFLLDFSQVFPQIASQFVTCVDGLGQAVDLMVDLYNFIQTYTQQIQFADYIANIVSAAGKKAKFVLETPEDQLYEKIQKALLGSMIYSEWETALQNFIQWIFPFEEEFQTTTKPRPAKDYLGEDVKDTNELTKLLLPDIKTWVEDLRHQIQYYKSSTFKGIDESLYRTEFNSLHTSTVPFHVWKFEENKDIITKVLSGKPVVVSIQPDALYYRENPLSAIKFNMAEIEIKARNSSVQRKIDQLLNAVRVELTHSGISRYIYEGKHYEMPGEKQIFAYNFERDRNGNRLEPNTVYLKLLAGDLILSPFTIWSIHLFQSTGNQKVDFEQLAKYAPYVDIELTGKGTFVRKPKSRGRNNMKAGRKIKKTYPLYYYTFQKTRWNGFESIKLLQ